MEIQAVANVSLVDVAEAIADLPAHEISDLFVQIAEKMDSPDDISQCANRLLNHCKLRFGYTSSDIPGFYGTLKSLNKLGT